MKIYTKGGDKGKTALWGAGRVSKSSYRLNSYGDIDELNSELGVVIASEPNIEIETRLKRVQTELMVLGSDLATPLSVSDKIKQVRISETHIEVLEQEIDEISEKLPELKNFILPGGGQIGAQLHYVRAVCRRSERSLVKLYENETDEVNELAIKYVNRLSDWLFTMARYHNLLDNNQEEDWISE